MSEADAMHAPGDPDRTPDGPLGLLGGTFDPVHEGHLALARGAQSALQLAEVAFIPAAAPWQKPDVSAPGRRLHMLRLAVAGHAGWRIDELELRRGGPSYTFDTLVHLRERYGADRPLVWIMGADQFARLSSWHRWQELLRLAHLAVADRDGGRHRRDPQMDAFLHEHAIGVQQLSGRPAGGVLAFDMAAVPCSSTQIREALARGDTRAVRACLPAPVLEFIRIHRLYEAHGHPEAAAPGR